jgi:hypothetical protein
MKFVVRPELPTASVGSSQAPTAAVVNSAPVSTHPEPTYKSGKAVQTTGTTSNLPLQKDAQVAISYQYQLNIPFLTPVSLTLASTSQMLVSQ